jgi:hypothetical protein
MKLGSIEFDASLYENNPHQSSLLSRVSADRFARLQRPDVVGEDLLASVLQKKRDAPWYIVPVLSPDSAEWSECAESNDKESEERRLIAYLSFDDGPNDEMISVTDNSRDVEGELDDNWSAFEADVLHKLDLFAACLAERKGMREMMRGLQRV